VSDILGVGSIAQKPQTQAEDRLLITDNNLPPCLGLPF